MARHLLRQFGAGLGAENVEFDFAHLSRLLQMYEQHSQEMVSVLPGVRQAFRL
jgi:hypothetical protein